MPHDIIRHHHWIDLGFVLLVQALNLDTFQNVNSHHHKQNHGDQDYQLYLYAFESFFGRNFLPQKVLYVVEHLVLWVNCHLRDQNLALTALVILDSVLSGFSVRVKFYEHGDVVVSRVEGNDGLVKVLVHVAGVLLDFYLEITFAVVKVFLSVVFLTLALGNLVIDEAWTFDDLFCWVLDEQIIMPIVLLVCVYLQVSLHKQCSLHIVR